MDYLKPGDVAKRNDNGKRVRVREVRPNGLRVFYIATNIEDGGSTVIVAHEDLRPDTKENK